MITIRTMKEQKKHYDEWIEEGYDDVIIEEITQ